MAKKVKVNWGKFIPFCIVIIALIAAAVIFVPKLFVKPCEHSYGEDGICTVCGEECAHKFEEGYCTVCGVVDPDFVFPDEIIDFSVLCGGDVMAHGSNLYSAYNWDGSYFYESGYQCYTTDGSFDFHDNYQYVKPYVEAADLALINLESTFSGGEQVSGYWGSFNAPDSLADALKDTGFDVIFTCNNHSLDYGGVSGARRTAEVLKNKGLVPVGSRAETSDSRSVVVDANGVKVGVVAYTYETGNYGDWRTLNGAAMAQDAPDYLNGFRVGYGDGGEVCCDEDKAAIKSEIEWCRESGAEVVICYFHWDRNNEYVLQVTNLQRDLASFAAESGADIIFGSHPHRVQRMEMLEVGGRQVPVYYSLGNFVSNQRYETMDGDPADDPYASEQEIFAWLEISYNRTQGTVSFNEVSAIPLYVDKFTSDKLNYRVCPLVGDYHSAVSELAVSGNGWRADNALATLTKLLGEDRIYK